MAIRLVHVRLWITVASALTVILAPVVGARSRDVQRPLPDSLTSAEFARLLTEFSEPGGAFHSDNFTSNEAQIVAAARALSSRPAGGVYIGVGPEQNFTLIVAARPRLAFILDIRRQAIVQHLLFKALFELSEDRADFLGRLFSRARPALPPAAPLAQIWDAIKAVPAEEARYRDQRRAVEAHLRDVRGLSLSASDLGHLDYVFKAFFELGPGINYGGYQQGLSTGNVDFARLSLTADADGVLRSFLGSAENFQFIREMHRRNLIVPIEGDFAGPKALRAIGDYIRSYGADVDIFYISNVEQYLFGQTVAKQTDLNGGFKAFFENAASLPRNDNSAFIRSAGLMSAAPLCPMSRFLDIALTKPITTQADSTRCAGLTAAAPAAPLRTPVNRQTDADAFTARVRAGTDVTWLERIATSDETLRREWLSTVGTDQVPSDLRQTAYVRLGAIGTTGSLAAARRVEAALRDQSTLASPSLTGWAWPSAAAGMAAGRMIAINSVQDGDREYAAVLSEMDGPFAPFILLRSRADARWQRPRLVGSPVANGSAFEPVVTLDGRSLSIAFRRKLATAETVPVPATVVVALAAITLDTDADGWTDIEERALGLRPDLADTDADGIPDGIDASPLYKPAPGDDRDDEAQILRRAMFAAYGLNGSRYAVFVAPGHRSVQLYGHSGPVFFDVALPDRTGCGRGARPGSCAAIAGGAQISWIVTRPTPADAIVQFTNLQGLGFRSATRTALKKVEGEWVVVDYRVTGMN
jgi:hypothetical protein